MRGLVRKLPLISRYEARFAGLNAEVARLGATQIELAEELGRMRASSAEDAASLPAGEFVPPGHFYSAIPDPADARARYEQLRGSDPTLVPGVDLNLDNQWELLAALEPMLASMPFGDQPKDGLRYGFVNDAYSYGDATILHLMLRWLRPQRFIEVGSGHSSACVLDTVDGFLEGACQVTFVEPYDTLVRSLLSPGDLQRHVLLSQPVQEVPLDTFAALEDGDLLFVDSTHVSKVGSDVNYLLFEVFPALKPGVIIHIHDVFPGFEYPWSWVEEGRAWTEDYLLRAFLQFNSEFEVLLWPVLLSQVDPARVFDRFPTVARNPGGALYLRRRGGRRLPAGPQA